MLIRKDGKVDSIFSHIFWMACSGFLVFLGTFYIMSLTIWFGIKGFWEVATFFAFLGGLTGILTYIEDFRINGRNDNEVEIRD